MTSMDGMWALGTLFGHGWAVGDVADDCGVTARTVRRWWGTCHVPESRRGLLAALAWAVQP